MPSLTSDIERNHPIEDRGEHSSTTVVERPSSRHIVSLDGYRGVAFLLVFLRHYTLTRHSHAPIFLAIMHVGAAGWAGVDLFFVLSGFLITGILLDTRTDPHYFRNFIVRRALRIFPLYYAVLFAILALTPLLHLQWHRGHILYFFYLGNVAANINPSLEAVYPYFSLLHLWSLSLEEQFYVLWPLAIYLAATPRRVVRLCLGLSVFALCVRIALLHWLPEGRGIEWSSAELPARMDGLLYGAIVAVLVRRFSIERLVPPARWLLGVAAVLLAVMFLGVGGSFNNVVTSLVGYPLLALFFSSLLVLALEPKSRFARFGRLSPLRLLGRYSYGLYIYHLIAGFALGYLLVWLQQRTHSIVVGGVLFTFAVFFGSLIAAVASYELYERHFLRLKRYFPYGNATPAAPGAAVTTT
jgi:peptidoglycan/LPS O-acetylase OafA/YrhL